MSLRMIPKYLIATYQKRPLVLYEIKEKQSIWGCFQKNSSTYYMKKLKSLGGAILQELFACSSYEKEEWFKNVLALLVCKLDRGLYHLERSALQN